jgi:adenosine deaminase
MPSLLVSLGTSQAIVIEAFLFPDLEFEEVHVLTTATVAVDQVIAFFSDPSRKTRLIISRVAGMRDLQSEDDHFAFEEALYRWILDTQTSPDARYVCLSGGYKTMSAAMQKAAAVLGAAEVFHVLADAVCSGAEGNLRQPSTTEEILRARQQGQIRYIRLGAESGWPQFHSLGPSDYPLDVTLLHDCVREIGAPNFEFCRHLNDIARRSHNIAGAWSSLAQLPFPELATWSKADLEWLRSPVDLRTDASWIRSIHKIELHTHLGGFATAGPELAKVRSAALDQAALPEIKDLQVPTGWPLPPSLCGLDHYMALGDNNGSHLLKTRDCLIAQCRLLYETFVRDRVIYAEVRCSPNNYATKERSALEVLMDIRQTFQECMGISPPHQEENPGRTPACHVNLIIIATRKSGGDRSDISRHLALAITAADQWKDPRTCRVVGVDLAGLEEPQTRAALFQSDFDAVHRVGLAVTVHAGENDDAEGIWQAVFKLNARRIGHGLTLFGSQDLQRAIADRGIGIEMCPYANVQIHGYSPINSDLKYPMESYLDHGIRVSINTDNIGISGALLSENLLLASRLNPPLTRLHILWLQRHAIDTCFLSAADRTRLLSIVNIPHPHPIHSALA